MVSYLQSPKASTEILNSPLVKSWFEKTDPCLGSDFENVKVVMIEASGKLNSDLEESEIIKLAKFVSENFDSLKRYLRTRKQMETK